MAKKKISQQRKIEVHSSKEGKLFIYASDLFAQKSIQDLIERVSNSKALEGVKKVSIKDVG